MSESIEELAQKLISQREGAARRARVFYEKNKAKISEKSKEDRVKLAVLKKEEKEQAHQARKIKGVLNYDAVIDLLRDLIPNPKTYLNNCNSIKALFRITGGDDLKKMLKKPKDIIKIVEEAKGVNDEEYSIATKRGIMAAVLLSIDKLSIPISEAAVKEYNDYYVRLKMKVYIQVQNKQTKGHADEETVPAIATYLKQVESKYGVVSKENIIANIYTHVITCRDDLQLKIVPSDRGLPVDTNYLIIPRDKRALMAVVLNKYKTDKKYNKVKMTVDKTTGDMLREYIGKKGIEYEEYIFGDKSLTSFISKMNKAIDTSYGGILWMRHMVISNALDKLGIDDVEERQNLAKKCMHDAVITQATYKRRIVK
jgi:hypothetical protein